ncbi:MAG TPA: DUF4124 domain-containing protein [Burkholderiaceae bacterium]|nr:DUF4124 domain-containing protein [Burkholderiaceae bacterium]
MRPIAIPIAAAILLLSSTGASAQLYKWVDENGVVNYGDWPPSGVKYLPVTQGTVSSVSGGAPRQQTSTAGERVQPRRGQRPLEVNETVRVSAPSSDSSGDAEYVGGYPPYYPYPRREVARAEAALDRPRVETPIAKPILPVDPAVPDMPLRPRR